MTRFYHSSIISGRSFYNLKTFSLAIFAGILILFNSCEDFISTYSTDTLSVSSYTMYSDSLESDNPEYAYMGQIYDPYFGTTTAGFVSQLRLYDTLGSGVYTVDSVKLMLTFADVSGDISAGHIIRLSEISDEIFKDSTYFSSQQVPLTGYSVEAVLPVLRSDTVNTITLDLPTSFGEYLIRDKTKLFYSENDDEPDFRSYFKGLYFQLIPSGNSTFIKLSLSPPDNFSTYKHVLTVYMHDADTVSSAINLLLDAKTKNAAFNTFAHDYSTAEPGKKIVHINDGIKDTLSYVQCLNGVYTKFIVPGLEDIKNDTSFSGIYINKARIICPVQYDGDAYMGASFPSLLYMGYYTNTGKTYLVPDYSIRSDYSSFYDGTIDTTAGNYTFNVASYVQNFLDDSKGTFKPEFQLALPEGSVQNAILKANSSNSPVKFELTYTRF
jgi:hypothetical protein